jgi:ketosteroid isomerase-like protein
VEVVQAICAAWEAGDFSSIDWAHPEIEFAFADGPTAGIWTGRPAMAKAWRETMSASEELHTIAEQYCRLDDERVLVLMHNSGRGKGSGLDVGLLRMKGANLFHVRDGKVSRLVLYWDRVKALGAVGLSE